MKWTLFLIFFFAVFSLKAEDRTETHGKFEWGGGLLNVYGNHYRGSDQSKIWYFPIPYFTYRSEKLEAEPSFIRGILFHNKWFSFKLSLIPGLNVESKNNRARAGMPSLDYSLEVGPMAIFHLWQSEDKTIDINFEWPARESFATDLTYIRASGIITVPYLNIIHTPLRSKWSFDSEFSISPMYADRKYHNRFFGVDSAFATPERPAYQAHGGYSGFQTAMVINKRVGHLAILSFLRWDYLKGAVFENSPLVKSKNYLLGGLGMFWMFD